MDLREARFKRRITQWALSKISNVHQSRISLIENGFPELLILYKNLGFQDFTMLLWLNRWLFTHGIERQNLKSVFSFPNDSVKEIWEKEGEALLSLAKFLLSEKKEVAKNLIQSVETNIVEGEGDLILAKIIANPSDPIRFAGSDGARVIGK